MSADVESRVAIVAAAFNRELVDAMVAFTKEELAALKLPASDPVFVTGCYELPLVCDRLLERDDVRGGVVLGYIERGETLHGEVMGHVVHKTLVDLQVMQQKPLGLGIIGPGATLAQAQARVEKSARAAVRALAQSLETLDRLEAHPA